MKRKKPKPIPGELLDHIKYIDGELFWSKSPGGGKMVGDKAGWVSCRGKSASGYACINWRGQSYKVHRVVWALFYSDTVSEIDHIDGNPGNNRIENLRPATRDEQMQNRKVPRHNTSGCKGVTWHKRAKQWYACIKAGGKAHNLGCRKCYFEAVCLRKSAELRLHGKFNRAA